MRAWTFGLLVGAALASQSGGARANDITFGPNNAFRFGLSAGPAMPNSQIRSPADRLFPLRANPAEGKAGPKLEAEEGGGSPMARGGVGDTLTGYRSDGALLAPQTGSKPAK